MNRQLTASAEACLRVLREHEELSTTRLWEASGVDRKAMRLALIALVELQLIEQVKPQRGNHAATWRAVK